MPRKTAIGLAVSVVMAMVLAAPAAKAEKALKLAHVGGADSAFSVVAKTMAAEVVRLTNGRYRIEEFGNSALGDEKALINALKEGTIDLEVQGLTGPVPAVAPELNTLTLPFLFDNPAHVVKVLDGPLGQALLDGLRDKGMIGLAWAENGFRQLTTKDIPVRKPEDVKALKIRTPKGDVLPAVWKALGAAEVIQINVGEVYDALKSGRINAQENPIPNFFSYNFNDYQNYIIKLDYTYAPLVVLMAPDSYDELSEEDRKLFVQAARTAGQASREFVAKKELEILEKLKAKGSTIITDPDVAAFREALKPQLADMAAKSGGLFEKIRALK